MIYWCKECNIPVLENKTCGICGNTTYEVAVDIRPVFTIEKILLSTIIGRDLLNKSVWNKGSIRYIVDGEQEIINYIDIMRNQDKLKEIILQYEKIYKGYNLEDVIEKQQSSEFDDKFIKRFIECNRLHLLNLEDEATKYINEIMQKYGKKGYEPIVSFSGGKDSTVVSSLVRDSLQRQNILHLFGDTTLEFPTTYEYVERFQSNNPLIPFIFSKSPQDFFTLCKEFGPPSRLERWCCTIFKTGPIGGEINNFAENMRAISFVGIRGSESKNRKSYDRTQNKSKISRQIVSMPIHSWKDVDVWLYILTKNLDFNSAYNMGFSRVGCWCCPNNSNRSDFLLSLNFKELFEKWRDVLLDYTSKAGIEDYDVYINDGYWKARRGLRGLHKLDTNVKSTECNISENAKSYVLTNDNLSMVVELFKPFGNVSKIFEDDMHITYSVANNNNNCEFDFQIYKAGRMLKIIPVSVGDIGVFYKRVECQVRKLEFCIGCMACDSVCPHDAISTTNGYYINQEKCKHCLKCIAKFTGGCLRVEKHKSKL